jgi:uncharacterized membrane protein YjgN (DUF898 family)
MGIGGPDHTAFEFEGNWNEFIPIALSNAALNLVTLGIYRFWATTRERRYLWSKTRFIDDHIEWTGTGLELFIGFVMAFFILGLPLFVIQFVAQGLILQGQPLLAGLVGALTYILLLYLVGFAIFRGLRYRLSRTYWHGIRGGCDNPGFRYGLSYLWKSIVGALPIGLLIPWSSASLWKERWEAMSFGQHPFQSDPQWRHLMKRFLLFYAAPALFAIAALVGFAEIGSESATGPGAISLLIGIFAVIFYIALPLIALVYYAAYLREMIGSLRLSTLEFSFTGRSLDWLILGLGNLGIYLLAGAAAILALLVFGGGMAAFGSLDMMKAGMMSPAQGFTSVLILAICFIVPFMLVGPIIRYRSWAFFIRHMEAGGEVSLDTLTQSTTREPKQGEGLLDAFDMGAI